MTEAHKLETLLKLTQEHLDIMLKAKSQGQNVDKQLAEDALKIEALNARMGR